jgi:hypothetical protein
MEKDKKIKLFLDDEKTPFAEFSSPVKFVLDTTKIPDGKHSLKIVAKSTNEIEGIKTIPFEVKNGPQIDIIGLKDNDSVSEQLPITINAYGSERNDVFIIEGSETPKGIPSWFWALVITFVAFGLFYLVMYWYQDNYTSIF